MACGCIGRTAIILFLLIYAADILIFCPHLHATSTSFALDSVLYAVQIKCERKKCTPMCEECSCVRAPLLESTVCVAKPPKATFSTSVITICTSGNVNAFIWHRLVEPTKCHKSCMDRNVCLHHMQDDSGGLIEYWIKWSENVCGTQQKLPLKLQSFIIIVSRRLTASPKVHSTCWRMNLIHSGDDSAVEILLSFSINCSRAFTAFFRGKFNLACVCHLHSNRSQVQWQKRMCKEMNLICIKMVLDVAWFWALSRAGLMAQMENTCLNHQNKSIYEFLCINDFNLDFDFQLDAFMLMKTLSTTSTSNQIKSTTHFSRFNIDFTPLAKCFEKRPNKTA